MPLETAAHISDLVSSNPAPTDATNQGDDHIRLLKSALKTDFVGVNAPATRAIGSSFGFLAGAGLGSSPSYSFSSNVGLGFYDAGSNVVGLVGSLNVTTHIDAGGHIGASGTVTGLSGSFTTTVGCGIGFNGGYFAGTTGTFSGAVTASSFAATGAISGDTGTFNSVVGALPAGAIMDFAGPTAPTGWLACDGAALSRTTYAQLYANIGNTWGAGNGSTTFNVPNLFARFRRHRDGGSLAGAVGTTQAPVNLNHTHTFSGTSTGVSVDHTHGFSGTSSTESVGHTHGYSGTSTVNSVDHTHTVTGTSGAMNSNQSHAHAVDNAAGFFNTTINNGSLTAQSVLTTAGGAVTGKTTSATNIDHTHPFSGTTAGASAGHTHDYSGSTAGVSASHTHTYSGTTSGISSDHTHNYSGTTAATGDANEARPYSATVLTCIKLFN